METLEFKPKFTFSGDETACSFVGSYGPPPGMGRTKERKKERHTMDVSPWRTRVGPIISVLGGLVMVMGFCLPLFVTSAPINPNFSNPYPPVVNGWDMIGMLQDSLLRSYLALTYVAPEVVLALVLAVVTLSTSVLALFQPGSRLVARTRARRLCQHRRAGVVVRDFPVPELG